jgi:hypothetical protein
MRATQVQETIEKLIEDKIPVFIWGAPGIGKSSIVKQVAKERGLEFVDLRLSLLDPTDLKGIPFFDKENHEAVWAKPNFLPKEEDSKGILFLDEINTAPPSVQASAYQLVLDRKVGDYELPHGWSIVAAGNNESDRGVVYRMPPPLANRFVHLEMQVDFEDWKLWAFKSKILSSVIGYLQYDKDKLFVFDPAKNEKSFPTPRSWEYVDRVMKTGLNKKLLFDTISGAVGKEVATDFLAFEKVMHSLPDIDLLLNGESKEEISHDNQVLFALCAGIVNHLKNEDKNSKVDEALKFSFSLPPEFSVMLVKDLQQSGINIESSAVWEEWVEKYSYLLV